MYKLICLDNRRGKQRARATIKFKTRLYNTIGYRVQMIKQSVRADDEQHQMATRTPPNPSHSHTHTHASLWFGFLVGILSFYHHISWTTKIQNKTCPYEMCDYHNNFRMERMYCTFKLFLLRMCVFCVVKFQLCVHYE